LVWKLKIQANVCRQYTGYTEWRGSKVEHPTSYFRFITTTKVHKPKANDLQNSTLSARLEIFLKPYICLQTKHECKIEIGFAWITIVTSRVCACLPTCISTSTCEQPLPVVLRPSLKGKWHLYVYPPSHDISHHFTAKFNAWKCRSILVGERKGGAREKRCNIILETWAMVSAKVLWDS
jgi:hypothetical protein